MINTAQDVSRWLAARGGWCGAKDDSPVANIARMFPDKFRVVDSHTRYYVVAIYPRYKSISVSGGTRSAWGEV